MEFTRIKAGLYESTDKRFRIERGLRTSCAPLSWWAVLDVEHQPQKVVSTETLAVAKEFIEEWAKLPLDE